MTTYAIFERDAESTPQAVPDCFSWFAAILPPVYAIAHGLWLGLLGFVVGVLVLVLAANWIGDGASFALYLLFAIYAGFEATSFRRAALSRRGWHYRAELLASAPDLAERDWLARSTPVSAS